ncbi:unnamed protein product [Mytilus coruscus]|uniref:Uncharacterized protein n=1 Tax=Mytilus coruscus TaxID=42192 RepID=A0A6J8AUU0_MYTCO|nr:unnamed protein product [Mytilus coruscus]
MNWADLIPSVMMAIRMSPNTESTGFSPYHMVFGKEMNIPFDISVLPKDNMSKSAKEHLHQLIDHLKIVQEVCKQNLHKSQEKSKQYYDKRSKEPDFRIGDRVLLQCMEVPKGLSPKLHAKWIGPYYITNVGQNNTYKLRRMSDHKIIKSRIHANRIKPYEDPRNVREPVRRIDDDINDNNSQNDDSIDIDKHDDEIQLPNNVDDENLEQDKQNDTDKDDQTQSETDDDSEFLAEKLVAKKKKNGKNYYRVKWVTRQVLPSFTPFVTTLKVIFMLAVLSNIPQSKANSILRLNYGILFEKQANVHFSNDVWMHTFQIRLPVKKGMKLISPCKGKDFCENFNKLANELNILQLQTTREFNQTITTLKNIIPTKGKNTNRKKKAILGFIGESSKSIFVTALPVPVNTSLHATQLMDAPEYLALSNDKKTYLSLTSQQVMKCKNYNNNMYCPLLQSFSVNEDSCLVSIFNNDINKVQSLCDFRFLHCKITPKIMYLKSSAIVVYKIPQISIDCSGKQIIHEGCDFCIMNIPCQCSIATKLLNYPPSITSCKRSNNITVVHPINLALLQQFFTSKQLTEINGSSTFVEKMNINVPDFKIYNHSYSSFLVRDQKEHLSLKKMAKVAKKEGVIFQDLAEPLLDGQIDIASITFIYCIWSFFKIRTLTTTILILERTINTHSASIPSFIFKPETTTTNSIISHMFNHTYFFSSSREKCFKEHIRCKEIFVKPGAKLEELANIAYQRLHTVQEPKIVYIMAGIPDICIKSKAPAYEESFYNLDDSNKLLSVQNILIQTRTKLESIKCKVVFVTITTMGFQDWNIHRLRCHKTSKLIYLNQYVDMQNKLNSVLHQLNKFITASNEDNNVVTPFLHTYVHKIMGK